MDTLYTYYKALRKLVEITTKDDSSATNVAHIRDTDINNDYLEKSVFEVNIDTDWIDYIDSKLEYIAKCIHEERQFILRTGEVLPVEKVKTVSRETVSHLSKHSNLIVKQEKDEVVPNRLYSVAKLTDYSVYENRFIYFLLIFLKDFINIRYIEITRYSTLYKSRFRMKKDITIDNRQIDCNIDIKESIDSDDERRKLKQNDEMLHHIQDIYRTVLSFLNTPLMVEVSKAPLIKKPIIVTNTLKMNQNFKEALALYNYLNYYDKKGFSVVERKKEITPYTRELSYAYSLLLDLHSNITYLFTNDNLKIYRERYNMELEENKTNKIIKTRKEVEHLKEKLDKKDISIEEYAIELEKEQKRNRDEINDLNRKLLEIEKLNKEIDRLHFNIQYLNDKLDDSLNTNTMRKQRFLDAINSLKENNVRDINNLNEQHLKDIELIHELNRTETKVDKEELYKLRLENKELQDTLSEIKGNNLILKAKLNAYRYKEKEVNFENEFVEEESFKELEEEYKTLKQLVKKQWKFTKKRIVKEVKEDYKYKKVEKNNKHEDK